MDSKEFSEKAKAIAGAKAWVTGGYGEDKEPIFGCHVLTIASHITAIADTPEEALQEFEEKVLAAKKHL